MSDGNGGNGHSGAQAVVVLTGTLSPTYVPVRDAAAVVAPVLELDGLEPWAEIEGPALALEETAAPDEGVPGFDDPAQLVLEPATSRDVPADDAPRFELADAEEYVDGAAAVLDEPAAAEAMVEAEAPAFLAEPEAEVAGADPTTAAADVAPDAPAAAELEAAAGAPVEAPAPEAVAAEPPAPPQPDPVDILYGQAREAAEAGQPEDAKRLYRELLALHPTHVRARNNLALLLDADGNHKAALAELDRALDIDPENGTLLVNRGALLGATGCYAAAERDLKKVLRVEPSNAEALFNLGVVMTKKGLWSEAVPQLKRAVELESDRAAAHYYLGEALNHVDDLAGALAAYQRAAELQPSNPRALYGLGIIYDRLARPDDAARMYRRSREVGRR